MLHIEGFNPSFAKTDTQKDDPMITLLFLQPYKSDIPLRHIPRGRRHDSPANLSKWEGEKPTFFEDKSTPPFWIRAEEVLQDLTKIHKHVVPVEPGQH